VAVERCCCCIRGVINLRFRFCNAVRPYPCPSESFDLVAPTPLTLRANLRLLNLMPAPAFGCG
jgi:hypothetical protein